jgi:hypothetical protein
MAETNIYTTKRGDTARRIRATLRNPKPDETPVNLTGAVGVTFIMRLKSAADGSTPKVEGTATIVSPATSGVVEYQWLPADVDEVGVYIAEWEVLWPGSPTKPDTYPKSGYNEIRIIQDLNP